MPGVYHAPYPDTYRAASADAAAAQCLSFIEDQLFTHLVSPDEVSSIVVEPIQGEGGYLVAPPAFLQGLRELTTKHGILLVVDEVQSGMGRTGKMFASDHIGLKGDIVTVAKGIASGLPLGVACARAEVMSWPPGAHASTFGGNPVACAAATTTIRLLKEQLVANAAVGRRASDERPPRAAEEARDHRRRARQGTDDRDRARARSPDEGARGRGAERAGAGVFRRGVLILGAGKNAVRLAPPLVFTREQADSVLGVLDEALTEVDGGRGQAVRSLNGAVLAPAVRAP